jgi:hypothetical protein
VSVDLDLVEGVLDDGDGHGWFADELIIDHARAFATY